GSQLESHGSPNWTTYAENVADGATSSADTMFQNYMNSPEHRSNILDSHMRYVGVGVVFTGSLAWNTLDFVDQYNSTSSPTSSSSSTSTQTSTSTKPKATAQAPRTAARTAPKTTTTKAAPRVPRTTSRSATRTSTVRHNAPRVSPKPRLVTHMPAAARQATAPVAPAAHVMAAPSPVALTTTPARGGREGHTLALVAALGILFVAASRLAVRRSLRTR